MMTDACGIAVVLVLLKLSDLANVIRKKENAIQTNRM